MAKQPYIPFYIGDYTIKTRHLPLNVRGGWLELIFNMWNAKPRGTLNGTIKEFAGMMSCDQDEANLVIQTLNQKNIFAYEDLGNGQIKISSRRMVRDAELSEKRKKTGSLGGNPVLLNQKDNQKNKLGYPPFDNDNDINNLTKDNGVFNYEVWTDDIINKKDMSFDELVYKESSSGLNIKTDADLIKAHEAKCIRENTTFSNQNHFRKSLLGYLKSASKSDTSNKQPFIVTPKNN
jgi:uncharacterized protein YdaU (DUF1376 family)